MLISMLDVDRLQGIQTKLAASEGELGRTTEDLKDINAWRVVSDALLEVLGRSCSPPPGSAPPSSCCFSIFYQPPIVGLLVLLRVDWEVRHLALTIAVSENFCCPPAGFHDPLDVLLVLDDVGVHVVDHVLPHLSNLFLGHGGNQIEVAVIQDGQQHLLGRRLQLSCQASLWDRGLGDRLVELFHLQKPLCSLPWP